MHRLWRSRGEGIHREQDDSIRIDVLVLFYIASLFCFSSFAPILSLDRFLWRGAYLSSPYETLIGLLGIPLMVMCLAGWMRLILVWQALKWGLLEPLERQPIRFAFSRIKVMGWMTMLRHGGYRNSGGTWHGR